MGNVLLRLCTSIRPGPRREEFFHSACRQDSVTETRPPLAWVGGAPAQCIQVAGSAAVPVHLPAHHILPGHFHTSTTPPLSRLLGSQEYLRQATGRSQVVEYSKSGDGRAHLEIR